MPEPETENLIVPPLSTAVTTWATKARVALVVRDQAIVAMREQGALLSEIAKAAGLSRPGVAKIIRRHAGPTSGSLTAGDQEA